MTLKIATDQSHKGASFIEIRELLIHVFFMTMLGLSTIGVYSQNSFHLNNALVNSFIRQPYYCEDERTDFFNVSSINELWCYMNNRFIVTLNRHPFWGGVDAKSETLLLGQPRLRQVRVIEENCILQIANRGCFGEFSIETEDKGSFNLANGTAWVYNLPEKVGDIWFTGIISNYNSAGYFFTLTNASELLFYEENNWIDKQTRALFIDFTVYNININLFCVCQLMFELPPAGGIATSYLFQTVKLIRYNDQFDHIIMACEIVFTVFCIYYTIELVYEAVYFKLEFLKTRYNYIDTLIMGLSWASVWVFILRLIATRAILLGNENGGMPESTDYQSLKNMYLKADQISAVTFFCTFLKLYRFIHFDTISLINTTLKKSLKDMRSFGFLFFIILLAYAELGTLLFSNFVESYSTLVKSLFTLLRILMGEFHYQEITRVLSLIGPLYIVSFVMFVVFLLLNMFLAIINATYSVVSSNVKVTRKSEYGPFLKHCCSLLRNRFKRNQLTTEPSEMSPVMNNSGKISQLMKRSGFSELEIDTFFSRYTVDNNREITEDVFQRVVHKNVGIQHLLKLRSRTNKMDKTVHDVVRKKEHFLDKVGHLMRR